MGSLRRLVFGISSEETAFERRGFRGGSPRVRQRLEKVGHAFIGGYHAALEDDRASALVLKLDAVENEFRGFAFEGAAMGLALLDQLTPWRRDRWANFLAGPGNAHTYMLHVGAGWVLARLPLNVDRFMTRLDPLLRWLALDGYGFHEGFFHWQRYLGGQTMPRRIQGYARRAFDHGLGRSLWFVDGGEVSRITDTICAFPVERQPDLWSGVGLASVYAGEADGAALKSICSAAGACRPQLAQGAAFAAKARQRAENMTSYTNAACETICGMSAEEAALLTDAALENLPADSDVPAYEGWRRRVQGRLTQVMEAKR